VVASNCEGTVFSSDDVVDDTDVSAGGVVGTAEVSSADVVATKDVSADAIVDVDDIVVSVAGIVVSSGDIVDDTDVSVDAFVDVDGMVVTVAGIVVFSDDIVDVTDATVGGMVGMAEVSSVDVVATEDVSADAIIDDDGMVVSLAGIVVSTVDVVDDTDVSVGGMVGMAEVSSVDVVATEDVSVDATVDPVDRVVSVAEFVVVSVIEVAGIDDVPIGGTALVTDVLCGVTVGIAVGSAVGISEVLARDVVATSEVPLGGSVVSTGGAEGIDEVWLAPKHGMAQRSRCAWCRTTWKASKAESADSPG